MPSGSASDRRSPRYSANFLLYHAGKDTFGYCYTRNIADGGCFVETGAPLELGTAIDIEMFVDLGEKAKPMVAAAEVMWSNRDKKVAKLGMGLAFRSMGDPAKELLALALDVVSSPQLPLPARSI